MSDRPGFQTQDVIIFIIFYYDIVSSQVLPVQF